MDGHLPSYSCIIFKSFKLVLNQLLWKHILLNTPSILLEKGRVSLSENYYCKECIPPVPIQAPFRWKGKAAWPSCWTSSWTFQTTETVTSSLHKIQLETFFSQGPALAAAVTISINECSHHEWHWERNRTVVIHLKWALRHEEHQRAERCWVRDLGIFGRKLSTVQFDAARSNLVLSQSS